MPVIAKANELARSVRCLKMIHDQPAQANGQNGLVSAHLYIRLSRYYDILTAVLLPSLQKTFKTLADPTRMRLLALLQREELAVGELMTILSMAQSTVSRHLGILREAGLVQHRREGTFVYYRFTKPDQEDWRELWGMIGESLDQDSRAAADRSALESILQSRAIRSRQWFDSVGPRWDALRKVFHDDTHRARAISKLVSPDLCVADIGTGTGVLAQELASAGLKVIAVDHSKRMLEAARDNLEKAGLSSVELRHGDANELPLSDAEVDAAFAHMVLHYVASPTDVIKEMTRILRPGGRVVIADFLEHDREWMKEELGVLWQGFPLDHVQRWFDEAGLVDRKIEVNEIPDTAKDLPASFIATARKAP
jgi:ArsR family transcriptional regulator